MEDTKPDRSGFGIRSVFVVERYQFSGFHYTVRVCVSQATLQLKPHSLGTYSNL